MTTILEKILPIPMTLMLCASAFANTLIYESAWSKPSNGLSARMVLDYEDESLSPVRIIHPKLILRNDSAKSINFFKCVYHAGIFRVKNPNGENMQSRSVSRSGGQTAAVVLIKPTESIEFDTYDYGYGINMKSVYVFNTSSFQGNLAPGVYRLDYSFAFDALQLEKWMKRYDWLKDDPAKVWTGNIHFDDIRIELE